MTSVSATAPAGRSVLLLADISGYSEFLRTVEAAHPEMTRSGGEVPPAYAVLSGLLDVVMERLAPTLTLSRIEGDAVFAYAPGERIAGTSVDFVGLVRSAYHAFGAKVDEAMVRHRHDCTACTLLPSLELKFVAHQGTVVVQRIAGQDVLAGPAVNVAHRLLKNSIAERTGRRAYLFVTDAAAELLGLGRDVGIEHEEHYADVGPVVGIVIGLSRAQSGGDPNVTTATG